MWDASNVFITDGSFMTSASCVNPSLTYMAFTARAVDHVVSELKKGNVQAFENGGVEDFNFFLKKGL